jgi:hypothetical protein
VGGAKIFRTAKKHNQFSPRFPKFPTNEKAQNLSPAPFEVVEMILTLPNPFNT